MEMFKPALAAEALRPFFESRTRVHISHIDDGLYLSDWIAARDYRTIHLHNITAVVSVTNARDHRWRWPQYEMLVPPEHHLFIPALDNLTQDLLVHLEEICDFIDWHLARPHEPARILPPANRIGSVDQLERNPNVEVFPQVLIHCQMGVSRSATVMIAYLMRKRGDSMGQVLRDVKRRRNVNPNVNFLEQLKVWEDTNYQIWADKDNKVPKEAYRVFLQGRAKRLEANGLIGDEPVCLF
jgi:dual specificity phosphatase 12